MTSYSCQCNALVRFTPESPGFGWEHNLVRPDDVGQSILSNSRNRKAGKGCGTYLMVWWGSSVHVRSSFVRLLQNDRLTISGCTKQTQTWVSERLNSRMHATNKRGSCEERTDEVRKVRAFRDDKKIRLIVYTIV